QGPLATGQSLGGNVRAGPGTEFDDMGSLPGGAPLEILRHGGASFNGYDWFEIRSGDLVGYQWGGIPCSGGTQPAGLFQQCGVEPDRVDADAGSGGDWLAFAVDGRGAFGHSHASTASEAEDFARQYCGNPDCALADETQEKCHALADARDGEAYFYGIGTGA